MTHWRCGGTITLEPWHQGEWKNQHAGGARIVDIGRCDKCGLAGIVCEPPRMVAAEVKPELVW